MAENVERFWLHEDGKWREVTIDSFRLAEQRAGFTPKAGCRLATGGFSSSRNGEIQGRITYGEITEKKYGWDPEFLKATVALSQVTN
ncbi:MAG: hypothetical protein WC477_00070 [Patescibacteria group bacterium]